MSSPFEKVPTEILHQVCSILDAVHPHSVVAFARASKYCYSVASTVLYRTLKVAIAERNQAPFHFLHGLKTRLLRDHAFEHVRRLILCAPDHHGTTEPRDWPYSSLGPCERAFADDTGRRSCWDHFEDEWYPNETSLDENEWQPVIRLVKRLPGLTDLYWVCHEQLPLRLLNILDSRTKPCRLHHYTFNFESSTEPPLNPYEHALITSPSLYSIGNLDYDARAPGSARNIRSPNLRRAYLYVNSDRIQQDDVDGHGVRKLREPVLREVIHIQDRGIALIPFSTVQAEAFGDLSSLRVLNLHCRVDPQGLPPPADFPSLETLAYSCPPDPNVAQQAWDELASFLRNLPRLTTLDISLRDRSISFTPALNKNLRMLKLSTWALLDDRCWRDDHIHRLADLCPHLEALDIEVPRSHGDAAEVSRYRSLGRLARLRELRINLCVSPPNRIHTSPDGCSETTFDTTIEPWFDEQDAKYLRGIVPYRQGHVRDLFFDLAVDEGLARAIFQVISDTKLAIFGDLSPVSLERLQLRASGGTPFPGIPGNDDIAFSWLLLQMHFLAVVDEEWLLRRDARDDAREVLHAHKIRGGYAVILDSRKVDDMKDAAYWLGIWRRVWPGEQVGVDWWRNWKSRPLALGDGGNEGAD